MASFLHSSGPTPQRRVSTQAHQVLKILSSGCGAFLRSKIWLGGAPIARWASSNSCRSGSLTVFTPASRHLPAFLWMIYSDRKHPRHRRDQARRAQANNVSPIRQSSPRQTSLTAASESLVASFKRSTILQMLWQESPGLKASSVLAGSRIVMGMTRSLAVPRWDHAQPLLHR